MFRDHRMPSLVEDLLKAAPGHAESLIELAAMEPEMFQDRRNWRETEKRLRAFVQVTETYRSRLASLDWMAVQTKSDIETDFAITGQFMDVERLIASLDAHLSELVRMCELPRPAKDAIHWGASRPGAMLKIRRLRDAAPGVPRALIADLINVAENLPDEHLLTDEDIR
ncbi:MAG: hypothetical protein MZV65_40450 [Chromatiales bacterium]|nr:hypothetical protein [Chromatiales bacterium]